MGMWRAAILAGFVFTLLTVGCGSDPKPIAEGPQGGSGGMAGAGGMGGTGGTAGGGGDGGSAGAGGSGGSEPRCGDGSEDPSEECDDGNEIDGDGCSSSCEWEGSCKSPIDWKKVVVPDPEFPEFFSTFPIDFHGFDVPGGGRCGGGGKMMVMRYVAPSTGRLVFVMVADGSGFDTARAYVRRTCEDPATELWRSCQRSEGLTQMDVVEGEVLYLHFDAPDAAEDTRFLLATEVFPYRAEGETCGPASGLTRDHMWQCAPGLTCHDAARPSVCSPNSRPSIDSIRMLRGGDTGNDLIAIVDLTDPNADYWFLEARAYDGVGAPVITTPNPGFFDMDPNQFSLNLDRAIPPAPELRSFAESPNLFERFPDIEQLDVKMRDLGNLLSDETTCFIEPQPRVGIGEACDPFRAESRCESDDLACRGASRDTSVCESREPDRALACAEAPSIGVGEPVVVDWEREDFDRPAAWPPPYSCFANQGDARSRDGRPELVFRLHLEVPRTNVVIQTASSLGVLWTALGLHEGCGLQGAPLACNNQDPINRKGSRIDFPELDAGDYLVVVSLPHDRASGNMKLTVDADPLE